MPTTGVHLWLILWKAYSVLHCHAVRDIRRLSLGFSDFAVLELLLHKGPTPVNTIGSKLRLASGSITAAVDRLERKQLVERRGNPDDRRARVVHLTETGSQLISCAFAAHAKAMEQAVDGLTPEEREQAVALLRKLGRRAQELLESDHCAN
jgi:MarR family transcriptional regulator, 2-MHQ and catechol-resistance regulon repressor